MLPSLFNNLNFPDNASKVMKTVMKLCAADFFEMDYIFVRIFGFRETKVFLSDINGDGVEKSVFANAGYDSSICFILLGLIFFLFISYVLY